LRTPRTPTAFERQVVNATDAGDGDYQTRTLRQRVAAEPENVEVRLELARVYREKGYPELALEHCRLAAARFPNSAPVALELARSLRTAGMREEAAKGLAAFLDRQPQSAPEYLTWLGILRDETGQLAAAEKCYRTALDLGTATAPLHNNLGYNLLLQRRNAEAAEEFRRALQLEPQSQVARNNLSLALANDGAADEAVKNWLAAGDPATAHNNMAAYLIEKGRYQEARKELDLALGYNRQHSSALKNLELVSRLDGAPATMSLHTDSATRWSRLKSGFVRLWVGPLQDQPAAAKQAAE
jgi:Flp pilus assembly protein TadD